MSRLFLGWTVACILLISASAISCSGSTERVYPDNAIDGLSLEWPPTSVPTKLASNYSTTLKGNESVSMGGNAEVLADTMSLPGGGQLTYAIFSVGNLSAENELTQIGATFAVAPLTTGDKTSLYVGIANYSKKCWEWYQASTNPFLQNTSNSSSYRNPFGNAYVAFVITGPGNAQVSSVTFHHSGNIINVDPPENFAAQMNAVQECSLTWDVVTDATGYNVYRCLNKELTNPYKLNSEPITEAGYIDNTINTERHYSYFATAVASNETDPSNSDEVWSYGIDIDAPTNFRVSKVMADSFEVSWEWSGANPDQFVVYIDTIPEFWFRPETRKYTIGPFLRTFTVPSAEPGVIYYVKMCAKELNKLGKLTEEIEGTAGGYWTWGDVEVIGTGNIPIKAVVADNDISVTYFNDNKAIFARRDSGSWTNEIVLEGSQQIFGDFLDIAYGNNRYCIAAQDKPPGDLWAAVGEPGSWNTQRLHGDGSTAMGHEISGMEIAVAGSDSEYAVVHYGMSNGVLYLNRYSTDSESWFLSTIYSGIVIGSDPNHSVAYLNNNLFVLAGNAYTTGLELGDRDGSWNWQNIVPTTAPNLPKYNRLVRFNNEWLTTAFTSIDKELYVLNGTSSPWHSQQLTSSSEQMGYYARLYSDGNEAVSIFANAKKYHFCLASTNWEIEPISVSGTEDGDYDKNADVVLLNGSPFLIFRDEASGEIKAVMGSPPEE